MGTNMLDLHAVVKINNILTAFGKGGIKYESKQHFIEVS
jgi:hypothetical protein